MLMCRTFGNERKNPVHFDNLEYINVSSSDFSRIDSYYTLDKICMSSRVACRQKDLNIV